MESLVALRGTGSFPSLYPYLADFDKSRFWWACLYKVWETEHPLAAVRPSEVSAEAVGEPVLFWTAGRRGPRQAPTGAALDPGEPSEDLAQALEGERPGIAGEEGEDANDQDAESEAPSDNAEEDADFFEEMLALLGVQFDRDEGDAGRPQPPGGEQQEAPAAAAMAPEGAAGDSRMDAMPAASGEAPEVVAEALPPPPMPPLPPAPDAAGLAVEPLPPVPPVAAPRLDRSAGMNCTMFSGGSITFYPNKNRAGGRFQAKCGIIEHGDRCRLTRTSNPPARSRRNLAQGRPLGLLAAWLEMGTVVDNQEEHLAMAAFVLLGDRTRCRQELLESPGGRALAAHERAQRAGEGEEPDGEP